MNYGNSDDGWTLSGELYWGATGMNERMSNNFGERKFIKRTVGELKID